MKTKKMTLIATSIAMMVVTGLFSGCAAKATPTPVVKAVTYSGTITAVGSSALQPLVANASAAFTVANPDATVNVQAGGSGVGLTQIAAGSVDIGNSDLVAADKLTADQASGLVDHTVCVVGFAAIVNSKVTVTDLKKADLIGIFTGKIKNWKEVGGADLKITIVNRPASSGTRANFKKYALDGNEEVQGVALTEDASGTVKKTVETTDGAIGYLASSYTYDAANTTGIKVLTLDGVEMTPANIESGKYNVWSNEHMYTKGEATGLTKAFLDYMGSPEVVKMITAGGYIPTGDMKVKR
ncbi:MAG TPA: phosphate ABC transporter substrate-binding protein [Clostridiaceae bacterium]